jgi:hypothetical protein
MCLRSMGNEKKKEKRKERGLEERRGVLHARPGGSADFDKMMSRGLHTLWAKGPRITYIYIYIF